MDTLTDRPLVKTCKNCLQYVGRILHRLLGARYKILYHEEPYLSKLVYCVIHSFCM